MTNISARGQGIVLKFWQCVLLDQRYILCSKHNFMRVADFCYNQAKFQPGSCGCQVSHGTLISPIWFITPKREIGFSQKFQQVSAQAWRRCLQFPLSRNCCYGNGNWLFLFNARYLSRGRSIVLKFWKFVLQDQRYILCLEHNFLRLQDFLL